MVDTADSETSGCPSPAGLVRVEEVEVRWCVCCLAEVER